LVLIGAVTGGLALGLAAGFLLFARTVAHYTETTAERADAIVVLTGGELRLVAAARLLAQGRGARLLISGVNKHTTPETLKRVSGLPQPLFACCVDIDFAHTTTGNAGETKAWAETRGFRKLIIVTSSYHMPRSLTELQRAMPDVTLLAHPVVPHRLHAKRWWSDVYTARVLLWEYVKFLPSAARYGIARLLRWESSALAEHKTRGASSR
jgi:uncharacterized SAM-binding protein YcdF (DUF218 family)